MTIEASQYISQLNTAFPRNKDLLSEGDDHIRLIKTSLKNTFPNIQGSVTISDSTLNYLGNSITATAGGVRFNNTLSSAAGVVVDFQNSVTKVGYPGSTMTSWDEKTALNLQAVRHFIQSGFPVGTVISCYVNPGTLPLWAGTAWVPFAVGRYLMGSGSGTATGGWDVGPNMENLGSRTFTLNASQIPAHAHNVPAIRANGSTGPMNRNWAHGHTNGLVNDDGNHGSFGSSGNQPAASAFRGDQTGNSTVGYLTSSADTNHEHPTYVDIPDRQTGNFGSGSPIEVIPAMASTPFWRRTA